MDVLKCFNLVHACVQVHTHRHTMYALHSSIELKASLCGPIPSDRDGCINNTLLCNEQFHVICTESILFNICSIACFSFPLKLSLEYGSFSYWIFGKEFAWRIPVPSVQITLLIQSIRERSMVICSPHVLGQDFPHSIAHTCPKARNFLGGKAPQFSAELALLNRKYSSKKISLV